MIPDASKAILTDPRGEQKYVCRREDRFCEPDDSTPAPRGYEAAGRWVESFVPGSRSRLFHRPLRQMRS